MSLARDLHMPVSELLERCSSAELTEWRAYHELEAVDREKADQRARAQQGRPAREETIGGGGQAAAAIAAYEAQEADG